MNKKSKILKAEYGSQNTPLEIGNIEIPCYVLEDGTALLSGRGMQNAIGFSKNSSGMALKRLLVHNKVSPFVSKELNEKFNNPIEFIRPTSSGSQPVTFGFEATILIDICYVLIDARNAGVLLTQKQELYLKQAEITVRAFSKVGIVAVIYNVTGYQDKLVQGALNDILNKLLLDEAKAYKVTYPLELYREWFRLNNWEWKRENAQKRPVIIGKWTNDLIYARMAPGLLKQLEIKNPKSIKGYRKHKHFDFLTDEVGEPKLREFFGGLIALSKASTKWRKYMELVNRAYPKYGDTMFLNLDFDED